MNDIKITKFNSRINLYLIMFRERERERGIQVELSSPEHQQEKESWLLGVHYLLGSLLGKIRKLIIAISVIKIGI